MLCFTPRRLSIIAAALIALSIACTAHAWSAEEIARTRAGMHWAQLQIRAADSLRVKVADEPAERRLGHQYLSADRAMPMWFVFPGPYAGSWHMRNVRYPLDIAYVDAAGRVVGVERMHPGRSGYSAGVPIRAALEVPAGQLAALGIEPGMVLRLESDGAAGL